MSNQSNLNILNFNEQPLHSSCKIDTLQEMWNNYVHNNSTYFNYFDEGSKESFEKQPITFYESTPLYCGTPSLDHCAKNYEGIFSYTQQQDLTYLEE